MSTQPGYDRDLDGVPDRAEPVIEDRPVARVAVRPTLPGLAVRMVLTLAGAALMIVSAFLDWLTFEGAPRGTEVPIQFLWSTAEIAAPEFLTSVGFVAIVLGLVAIVGLALRTGVLTSLAGALGVVVFVLSTISLYRFEGDIGIQEVGIGAWMVLVGGLVALIGGFFGARPVPVVTTAPPV